MSDFDYAITLLQTAEIRHRRMIEEAEHQLRVGAIAPQRATLEYRIKASTGVAGRLAAAIKVLEDAEAQD